MAKPGGGDAASLLEGKGRFGYDVLYLRKKWGLWVWLWAPCTAEMPSQTAPCQMIPIKTSLEAHLQRGHGGGGWVA